MAVSALHLNLGLRHEEKILSCRVALLPDGSGEFSFIMVERKGMLTKFESLARILSALKKPKFVIGTETFGSTRERNASMRNDFLGRPVPCLCVFVGGRKYLPFLCDYLRF